MFSVTPIWRRARSFVAVVVILHLLFDVALVILVALRVLGD